MMGYMANNFPAKLIEILRFPCDCTCIGWLDPFCHVVAIPFAYTFSLLINKNIFCVLNFLFLLHRFCGGLYTSPIMDSVSTRHHLICTGVNPRFGADIFNPPSSTIPRVTHLSGSMHIHRDKKEISIFLYILYIYMVRVDMC